MAAAVGLMLASQLFAADSNLQPILPPNTPLIGDITATLKIVGSAARLTKSKIVQAADAPGFTKAAHVTVSQRPASDYEAQFDIKLPDLALKNGDLLWAGVYARTVSTSDESGQGIIGFVMEEDGGSFDKLFQRRVSIGKDWQLVAVPVRVHKNYAAGKTHLTVRLGGAIQTIEVGGIRLVRINDASTPLDSLPQTRLTYGGREPDAAWRKAADDRIEQLRKAPITIRVQNAAGQPVANASVKVEMTQHAYPFGSCYNIAHFAGKNAGTADSVKYRETFAKLFNVGVDEYAMKWGFWEDDKRRPEALETLKWMDDHGIRVRGHTLVWPAFRRNPNEIKKLENDPAELARRIDKRVYDTAKSLAGRVTEWDVVNEPYANNDFMKLLGGDKVMARWFKLAHEADPNVPLYLNETSVPTSPPRDQHYDVLYNQVRLIQAEGGPISGVGMQAHFGTNLTDIYDLQTIYDRFATLGVPLQITELDINTTDDQLQADYMRDLMTITFAHPNSSGIMIWGFWQGQHWRPDAAMFRKDWSIKPVGQAWIDLVKKKWWTNAALSTAANGSASVRGFLGDYTVTVTDGIQTQSMKLVLPKTGASAGIVLK